MTAAASGCSHGLSKHVQKRNDTPNFTSFRKLFQVEFDDCYKFKLDTGIEFEIGKIDIKSFQEFDSEWEMEFVKENGGCSDYYEIIFYDGLNRFEKYLFTMQKELKKENYNNLKKTEKYIGIYDKDNILLYAGKKEDKQSSVSKIKKNYPKAVYFRNMIKSKETNILYILEKQNIE